MFSLLYMCSLANEFLVEGFRHCSVKEAARLKDPAVKLVIAAIQDSSHFVMDYLLELQPVRALQGTTLFNVCLTVHTCCMVNYIFYNSSCYKLLCLVTILTI